MLAEQSQLPEHDDTRTSRADDVFVDEEAVDDVSVIEPAIKAPSVVVPHQLKGVETTRTRRKLAGPDRRVLRAFYTQYVGVLLIILTFTVGAFQRTLNVPAKSKQAEALVVQPAQFGEKVVEDLFNESGSIAAEHTMMLDAMAEVLRRHDVDLDVTIAVPRLALESEVVPFERGLGRLEQIERFFEQRGVPGYALTLRVVDGLEGSSVNFRFNASVGRPE